MIRNEIVDAILHRRSIRKYEDRPLRREELETIIECGRHAPNARNFQTYRITVISDKKKIRRIAEMTAHHLGGVPEDHDFYGAAHVVLLSDRQENYMAQADCACVLENMFIAAESMGIGSVWINQFETIKYLPDVVEFCESVGIAKDHYVFGAAGFGYPAEKPELKPRVSEVEYFD